MSLGQNTFQRVHRVLDLFHYDKDLLLICPSQTNKLNLYCTQTMIVLLFQGDDVVLQSIFTSQDEHVKLCLAAEGFGTRLCRLESTSNCKVKSSILKISQYFITARAVHLSVILTLCQKQSNEDGSVK